LFRKSENWRGESVIPKDIFWSHFRALVVSFHGGEFEIQTLYSSPTQLPPAPHFLSRVDCLQPNPTLPPKELTHLCWIEKSTEVRKENTIDAWRRSNRLSREEVRLTVFDRFFDGTKQSKNENA